MCHPKEAALGWVVIVPTVPMAFFSGNFTAMIIVTIPAAMATHEITQPSSNVMLMTLRVVRSGRRGSHPCKGDGKDLECKPGCPVAKS